MTPRLLIVDDTDDMSRVLAIALKRHRRDLALDFECANSADEGLKKYRAAKERGEPFDLIVSDIAMPQKSGLEMVRELRAAGEDVKVIFQTAYDGALNRHAVEELGAVDYLQKPMSPMETVARIEKALLI